MAAIVATKVAIIQGRKISVGDVDFSEERMAIIETGINVNPLACKHKNIICALLAFSGVGLMGLEHVLDLTFIPLSFLVAVTLLTCWKLYPQLEETDEDDD